MDSIALQLGILGPALLAGALVLSTHVPLGKEVLRRGIIFLDLAIAQVAALGLIIASMLGLEIQHEHGGEWIANLIAITAAILAASLLYQFRHLAARTQEALIGILFILAATGSVLLLSKDPQGGERLREILVGQILWVEYSDLLITALVYAGILLSWFRLRNNIGQYAFYPLFAVTITLSTQLVGVYLVFASLIVPALASQAASKPLLFAYLIGILGYISGLTLSALFDFPSGAMIAWCLVAIAGIFWVVNSLTSPSTDDTSSTT